MSQILTRRGARELTEAIDRIASVVQENPELLGVDPRIAQDFAHRCDKVSDWIEGKAAENFPKGAGDKAHADEKALKEDADPDSDDQNKPDAFYDGKKAGVDEEGMSVEPDGEGFDANEIADQVPGPHQHEADEPYMATFTESEFHELADKQQSGQLPGVDKMAYSDLDGHIDRLGDISIRAQELEAQLTASVDPLLKGGKLSKDAAKAHSEVSSAYGKALKSLDKAADDWRRKLISARAKAKAGEFGAEGLAVSAAGLFADNVDVALGDLEKNLRLFFQGVAMENRALGGRMASNKTAGPADLMARFQTHLMKNWRRMVQVADNAASLVAAGSKDLAKAMKDSESLKMASDEKTFGFNLFA